MSTIASKDGTKIGYDAIGSGPALVLVDGAMCYRQGNSPLPALAELLKSDFTVYTYDRRGRGESGDTQPYALEREIEDIEALIDAAGGSAFVYGISSGAVLAAKAASALTARVPKLALYEAPLIIDKSRSPMPENFLSELRDSIAHNKRSKAVKMFMTLVGMPKFLVALMPAFPGWSKGTAIAHTLVYDVSMMEPLMRGREISASDWASVVTPTLVMAGGNSPAWMQNANQSLADALPDGAFRTLPGQTHMLKPEAVAPILKEFFKKES